MDQLKLFYIISPLKCSVMILGNCDASSPDFHWLLSNTASPTSYCASVADLTCNFIIMSGHRQFHLKVTEWEPLSLSCAKPIELLEGYVASKNTLHAVGVVKPQF